MAGLPDAAFPRWSLAPIYPLVATAASLRFLKDLLMTTDLTRPDFIRSLDALLCARGREATRQVVRHNEFQLIGAITKRPN